MYSIKQPSKIIFGKYSAKNFKFLDSSLIITSPGSKSRGWLDYLKIKNYYLFDQVSPNPSMDIVLQIKNKFLTSNISNVIGLGGGSSLDVAKFVAFELKKPKILIPTTFGSGSEVTRISVLKINGKKKSFHNDYLIADVALVDPFFINETPVNILQNSVIDACAQCTEGYDSKLGNPYTKFLCMTAFNLLEYGILNHDLDKIVLGSLVAGLGFGNCSTTLGHALSYVFSNEGISHGHALAFTTTLAHKFNNSIFYERFKKLVNTFNFDKIHLTLSLDEAADLILSDRAHLDNNPINVSKHDVVSLLQTINSKIILD
jgi:succinate semialdehyde reductase